LARPRTPPSYTLFHWQGIRIGKPRVEDGTTCRIGRTHCCDRESVSVTRHRLLDIKPPTSIDSTTIPDTQGEADNAGDARTQWTAETRNAIRCHPFAAGTGTLVVDVALPGLRTSRRDH